MNKIWIDTAPSNIALIKYMGKRDVSQNIPDNPSLSLTLPHLVTKVGIEAIDYSEDHWEPLREEGFYPLVLGPKGTQRFLGHFKFLKQEFGIEKNFKIKSANNFPGDCGLASSASSFAALTKCAVKAFSEIKGQKFPEASYQAALSRRGSGSSCRSFLEPWCVWTETDVAPIQFPQKRLIHMVVVSNGEKKKVSSSEAHKMISTSMLYRGRDERARIRLGLLINALGANNWKEAFEICWAEFWDMHALFETSNPSFGYMNEGSLKILKNAKSIWNKIGDGPLITMDAGPNVHLIFRAEQKLLVENLKEKYKGFGYQIFLGQML